MGTKAMRNARNMSVPKMINRKKECKEESTQARKDVENMKRKDISKKAYHRTKTQKTEDSRCTGGTLKKQTGQAQSLQHKLTKGHRSGATSRLEVATEAQARKKTATTAARNRPPTSVDPSHS
ncbi:Hypothetical predicted protein [Marmota monax]|uniref:Uncharacterized protein n=1 Tax=Marmota monax TaxID=9995 RepID=A0A5E4AM96_MARMO|nr:Hypothetical predicted protein [Marmota monax]